MRQLAKSDPASIGSYRLLGVLGGGGMGRVYLGQSRSGKRLAIKVLSVQFVEDPEYRQRFAREIEAARRVSPLFTAAVVDADPQAEYPWLATTFIDGPSLQQWVDQHGGLDPRTVLALAAGLAEALASIHSVGLVHRDLKPTNVLITADGPHIIDFGIALAKDDVRITSSPMIGTPSYMAPERVNGLDAGPPGDVFSLGATLYFAATGGHLIRGGSFYEQIVEVARGGFDLTKVSQECRPLIELCLKPAPQDRPTPEELMRVLAGLGVSAPAPGWWHESTALRSGGAINTLTGRPSRRRFIIATSSALGVLAAGGGVAAGLRWLREPEVSASTQPSAPPSGSRSALPLPPRVLWQVSSGSDHKPSGPDATKVLVAGNRVVGVAEGTVIVTDESERRLWTQPLPAAALRLWLWGDAILVGDRRQLWLLDAETGDERFHVDPAGAEEKFTRDNPDRMTIQIEQIAIAGDRALIRFGTALVAIDRTGATAWRLARPFDAQGFRTPPPLPWAGDATRAVTKESGPTPLVALRDSGTGRTVWRVPDIQGPPPAGPPPGEGDEAWERAEGRMSASDVVLRDGQRLQVRSRANGRLRWQDASPTPVASIELAGDVVLTGSDVLVARRLRTGEPLWEKPIRAARLAVPPTGDRIVAAHDDGVSILDFRGAPIWEERYPDSVEGTMPDRVTVDDRAVYVTFKTPGGGPPGRGPGGPGGPRPDDKGRSGPPPADVVAYSLA